MRGEIDVATPELRAGAPGMQYPRRPGIIESLVVHPRWPAHARSRAL